MFFLTPIMYSRKLLDDKQLGWMVDVNPIYWILELTRTPAADGPHADRPDVRGRGRRRRRARRAGHRHGGVASETGHLPSLGRPAAFLESGRDCCNAEQALMPKIEVTNASIAFTVRQSQKVTLKEYVVKGLFRQSLNPAMTIHALSDFSLSAADGDRIGIIGHNGAGKTTLLKMLAGIYPPTEGSCSVEGRICSLFDITLGFEQDATGWENITYRAYLQGETPATLRAKIDDIGAFSELGDFLTLPVRNYSAGMRMRLAFAIATATDPEILLIDEVLAVGDMAFQMKARAACAS